MRINKTNDIDCFFIGHNQIAFQEYEQSVRKMGIHSGAYRDLGINILQLNNQLYSAADIFNLFCCHQHRETPLIQPIKPVETFNAGIAYLGTYLHRRGFTFDFVNSFQDEKEYLREKLEHGNVLATAILTTLYVTPVPIVEIIRFIRQHNPFTKIIVGGPFVSTKYRTCTPAEFDYLLKSLGADFYVNSSQGEAALVKIIGSLKNNLPLNKINNIYYKTENGYVSTPLKREDNQLDENMVNWDLFADRAGEFVNVRTCISCPFSCAFCGFPQHAGKYQTADLEAVEKELNSLNQIPSLKHVDFVDDTFNVPPGRFKDIARMIIKNKYKFTWHSQFRCQYADREMVELMKESGCKGVFLGIESGNNQILENMNKAVTVEQYRKGIELLKKYDILTFGCFIVGFPGETDETVQDTFDFIEDTELDFCRAQLWFCDPVTPIWDEKEKYQIKGIHFKWYHATMDYSRGCDLIEQGFKSLKKSLWVPQYNFEFDGLFHLMNRGMNLDQVRLFLKGFSKGIGEKLGDSPQKEASPRVIEMIKQSCPRCAVGQ
ncbi:MAG: PhpK family radical SAM P-methyltransferase [Candidatus Aminicenantes bacterium]|nr:MAG: PhpK family radical SAM P-methyltransferase [Candidatus Aminicenantes bacterium]